MPPTSAESASTRQPIASVEAPRPQRWLICRLSAIGDCLETLPLAAAIKRHSPQHHISWITDCAANQLLARSSVVDQLLRVPKGFLLKPGQLRSVAAQLRQLRADIAIDPQGLTKSGLVAWLSGAGTRIGFSAPTARELSGWFYTKQIKPRTEHLVDRQLELLGEVGIATVDQPVSFGQLQTDAEVPLVDRWLETLGWGDGRWVSLNPSAGWYSRQWCPHRYGELARRIVDRAGWQVCVLWGGAAERLLAEQVVQASRGTARLAPDMTLPQLAEWLRRTALYIGSDTGPMHLSVVVGTRCVGLFGPTRYQHSGPYGAGHRCLQNQYHAGTSRQRRNADNAAMLTIDLEQVWDAVASQLALQ
jgi:heptosyltransferase I